MDTKRPDLNMSNLGEYRYGKMVYAPSLSTIIFDPYETDFTASV